MATEVLFNNNAISTLLAGITNVATTLSVQAGKGALFASPGANQVQKITLFKTDMSAVEVVHLITRSGDTFSVIVRAQEGTTGVAWNAGDGVMASATAGILNTVSQLDRTETHTAAKTFSAGIDGVTAFNSGIGPSYMQNIGITALANTPTANDLTVAITTKALTTPTAADKGQIEFRNATQATGNTVTRNITAATQITPPAGAALGFSANVTGFIYVYALDNAGTIEAILSGSNHWDETIVQNTTAISAAADSGSVLYSTTARTNVPIRYVGKIKIQTGATAGNWSIAPTILHVGNLSNIPITIIDASSASGTSVDFTGIPLSVKRITVMFIAVSTNGTSPFIIQLGDSGGVETTGYAGSASQGGSSANAPSGFIVTAANTAAGSYQGKVVIDLQSITSNTWLSSGSLVDSSGAFTTHVSAGSKSLTAELDRIRITTFNGTDTFDAGFICYSYE